MPRLTKPATTRDLYQEVTDHIVNALEQGVAPWAPSHTTAPLALPCNGATGRPYSGLNVLLLWIAGRCYLSPEWYTFNQARALGACVRKGEHGTAVTFWREIRRRNTETGEDERIPLLRRFVVFNRAQIDGLPETTAAETPRTAWERIEAAEQLVQRTGARVTEDAARPCYLPAADAVHMPAREAYPQREGFYADLLHELAHWTGHPSRLARPLCGAFGSADYAREELVAELASAFTCAALGITGKLTHADYLAAWLRMLREDKRAIFTAAAAARRAADYLASGPSAARPKAPRSTRPPRPSAPTREWGADAPRPAPSPSGHRAAAAPPHAPVRMARAGRGTRTQRSALPEGRAGARHRSGARPPRVLLRHPRADARRPLAPVGAQSPPQRRTRGCPTCPAV